MSVVAENPEEIIEVEPTVAVIGGGITGLMCARRLSQQGVHVVMFEALSILGGQLRKTTVAEHDVDLGAEALHISAPGMKALISEVGLSGGLINSNSGTSWLWTKNGLQRLPEGVGPAGPRKLRPVLRSGVMSMRGLIRAGLEPIIPRRAVVADTSVGAYVGRRFGQEVVERFVDPVLGSLHAGDVYRLSLRSITPELASIAEQKKSIMLSRRKQKSIPQLTFASWLGGLTTLVQRMLINTGVEVRTLAGVDSIEVLPENRYRLNTWTGETFDADAVVLAVPARVATKVVGQISHVASDLLGRIRYASVATVIAAYPKSAVEGLEAFKATGLLVPSSRKCLLKAATFVSTKWAHMNDSDVVIVRLSAGRINDDRIEKITDDELVEKLHADLVEATGINAVPLETFVQRWPQAIPQMEVGHVALVAKIREDLSFFKGIYLAGSSYDGLGIAACMRSGSTAAAACLTDLGMNIEPSVN